MRDTSKESQSQETIPSAEQLTVFNTGKGSGRMMEARWKRKHASILLIDLGKELTLSKDGSEPKLLVCFDYISRNTPAPFGSKSSIT